MPRFFFDVTDGLAEFRDEAGIELAQHEIVGEVHNLLRLLAHERLAEGPVGIIVTDVRNEAGRIVFRSSTLGWT